MSIRRGGPPAYTGPLGVPLTPELERIRDASAAVSDAAIDALMAREPGMKWPEALRMLMDERAEVGE